MQLSFFKYHGSGNDFILIDNREQVFHPDAKIIKHLCDRHFGIGADGLMTLSNDAVHDFAMKYYNADGKEGSMCGNGGRCIVLFARQLGLVDKKTVFSAIDGSHEADILSIDHHGARVKLQMQSVSDIKKMADGYRLNTGSPHFVKFQTGITDAEVIQQGEKYRYDSRFAPFGTNVNFVEVTGNNSIYVRTYERGVENETLSCGTGVTASAIAAFYSGHLNSSVVKVATKGGDLVVIFEAQHSDYKNIYLQGPAKEVFKGEILIK